MKQRKYNKVEQKMLIVKQRKYSCLRPAYVTDVGHNIGICQDFGEFVALRT